MRTAHLLYDSQTDLASVWVEGDDDVRRVAYPTLNKVRGVLVRAGYIPFGPWRKAPEGIAGWVLKVMPPRTDEPDDDQ